MPFNPSSNQILNKNYETDHKDLLLEQYKMYVEMHDRISARRNQVNSFFISLTLSRGGHPASAKGNPPAPPAAKVQSKKTPEAKTKSADPIKPDTAKKKTTHRKAPVSKNSTTCSSGTVKDPKGWVMLNEKFFLTKSIVTQQDRSIVLQLSPTADREQVAELKSLHPGEFHNRKQITYADQYEVGIMQVSSVLSDLIAGKTSFNIALTPTQNSQSSSFAMEMNYNNYSADEIARLRARRILLGEPLPKDLKSLFHATQAEKGIFPELWVKLQTQPKLFLPKAWLKAVYCLKMNGIVEDVLELELGTIKNKVMPVRFRGRRRQVYTNQEPSIIEVVGSCTLGE